MWSQYELREIRVFITVAEELHFGRAADRLQITPSYVSQTIRTLEAKVGGRLFDRTSRRVRLTPLGEQLRRGLVPVYEQLLTVLNSTREAATGVAGVLRLGSFARPVLGPHMNEIIGHFESRHPDCRVAYIDTGSERDYLDWLRAGDVDIIAGWLPVSPPQFTIGPILARDERILVVARDHPLAGRESVTLEDLAAYPVPYAPGLNREMMDAFVPPVTPSGLRLRRLAVRTTEESLMRVAKGELVHPTGSRFLNYYSGWPVTAVPISDLPPVEAALVWRTADRSAKVQAFVRAAADLLARHETGASATSMREGA